MKVVAFIAGFAIAALAEYAFVSAMAERFAFVLQVRGFGFLIIPAAVGIACTGLVRSSGQ
jgi:hypothetical protein